MSQRFRRLSLRACMASLLISAGSAETHAIEPFAEGALDPLRLQQLLRTQAFGELDRAVQQTRDDLIRTTGSEALLITLFEDAATSDPAVQEGLAAWQSETASPCEAATARAIGLLYRAERAWGDVTLQSAEPPAPIAALRDDARGLLREAMALPGCAIAYVVGRPLLSEEQARRNLAHALRQAPGSVLLHAHSIPVDPDAAEPAAPIPAEIVARLGPAATTALHRRLAMRRAQLLAQGGWALRAAQSFELAIRSSSNPEDLRARAAFFEMLAWRDDAMRDYIAALELAPHFRPAHVALAREALERRDLVHADAHVAMLLESDPRDPIALQMRANLHLQRDEPDRAIEALHAALEVGSYRPEILAGLGELRRDHHPDLDRSLAYYQAAIDLAPTNGRYHAAAALVRCMQSQCWLLWELQELNWLCQQWARCDGGIAEIANRAVTAKEDDAGIATAEALEALLEGLRGIAQDGPLPPL